MLQNVASKSLYASDDRENLIKPLNCADFGCMGRKGRFVAVHDFKASGAAEVQLHSFYTSALAGDKWTTSSNGNFTFKTGTLIT
jgi:hypothetical protein